MHLCYQVWTDPKCIFLSLCVNSYIGNHATPFWWHKKLWWQHQKSVSLSPSANGPLQRPGMIIYLKFYFLRTSSPKSPGNPTKNDSLHFRNRYSKHGIHTVDDMYENGYPAFYTADFTSGSGISNGTPSEIYPQEDALRTGSKRSAKRTQLFVQVFASWFFFPLIQKLFVFVFGYTTTVYLSCPMKFELLLRKWQC